MATLDFPPNPSPGDQYPAMGLIWTWDGAKWTSATNEVTGIPDAPNDGQIYGRQFVTSSMSWSVVSTGSTPVNEAPVNGTTYGRNNATWVHLTHADITDWAASIPQASSAFPIMDGTASAGTGAAYSLGNHIHPTDTTRAPINSPTFVGAVTIPHGASIADYATIASPSFTGIVTIPPGALIAGYAPLASPAFLGVPTTASTPNPGDSSFKLATTQFVGNAITNNAYTLPVASTTILGGVKVDGTTITVTSGVISAAASAYTLPVASTTVLGGVKVDGTTITIASGVISAASSSYTLPIASTTILGGVKVDGSTITIASGVISAASSYTLPVASTTTLGGVKVDGSTITIASGVISAAAPAVPLPSATLPIVNGVAAIGNNTTHFANANHVHPTDTSLVPIAGGTMTGALTIGSSSGIELTLQGTGATVSALTGNAQSANLVLNKNGAGNQCNIWGMNNASARWSISLGSNTAEGPNGSNNGSGFVIARYADGSTTSSPTLLDLPIQIARNNGFVTFVNPIIVQSTTYSSDRRLKEDIAPIAGALAIIEKLEGVYYRRKAAPDRKEIGLIAQDVAPVLPEVVLEVDDEDRMLGVDYSKIVAVLINAVKELSAKVAALEAGA